MADTTPTELFTKALNAYGEDYLSAEKALRVGGETTATALKKIAADGKQTPLARFIAATIADFNTSAGASFDAALASLDGFAAHAAKTPLGTPTPDTAAAELALFDDISAFIALRMLKEIDWPYWKVMTAIVYLGFYATASTLPAIDQFRTDLTNGKRPALGDQLDEQTKSVIAKLDEAAQLVRIVIADEQFKTDLAKAKQGTTSDQQAAAEDAVVRALSVITADPERARRLSDAADTLQALAFDPVLEATEGAVDADQVRSMLAGYFFGRTE